MTTWNDGLEQGFPHNPVGFSPVSTSGRRDRVKPTRSGFTRGSRPRQDDRATMKPLLPIVLALLPLLLPGPAAARTVYRCVQNNTVSLATAPEPGSKCKAQQVDDNAVQAPNLWGNMGVFSGTLYEREQDGQLVYSTRNLPGSRVFLKFTVATPPGEPAHEGLGKVGKPQLNRHAKQFKAAARATGVDDAWLRAIAHAESNFDAGAVSPKGAQGVMQLMPDTATELGVSDPLSAEQSINGGARYLKALLARYKGDRTLAAAAYNAGIGAVTRYKGVPPYAETMAYVEKVSTLYASYREAMGFKPETPAR